MEKTVETKLPTNQPKNKILTLFILKYFHVSASCKNYMSPHLPGSVIITQKGKFHAINLENDGAWKTFSVVYQEHKLTVVDAQNN